MQDTRFDFYRDLTTSDTQITPLGTLFIFMTNGFYNYKYVPFWGIKDQLQNL